MLSRGPIWFTTGAAANEKSVAKAYRIATDAEATPWSLMPPPMDVTALYMPGSRKKTQPSRKVCHRAGCIVFAAAARSPVRLFSQYLTIRAGGVRWIVTGTLPVRGRAPALPVRGTRYLVSAWEHKRSMPNSSMPPVTNIAMASEVESAMLVAASASDSGLFVRWLPTRVQLSGSCISTTLDGNQGALPTSLQLRAPCTAEILPGSDSVVQVLHSGGALKFKSRSSDAPAAADEARAWLASLLAVTGVAAPKAVDPKEASFSRSTKSAGKSAGGTGTTAVRLNSSLPPRRCNA